MSRPRNERDLPSRVPDRNGRGHLRGGFGTGFVWVNSSLLGVGATVEVDPDEAERFADSLYAWANRAREAQRRPNG